MYLLALFELLLSIQVDRLWSSSAVTPVQSNEDKEPCSKAEDNTSSEAWTWDLLISSQALNHLATALCEWLYWKLLSDINIYSKTCLKRPLK